MAEDVRDDVEAEIDQLRGLDLEGLQLRWRSVFGRTAPALSKQLLLRLLAYRVQAQTLGDLSPSTRRLLDDLSRQAGGNGDQQSVAVPGQRQLMTGTVLIREHDGHQHHVVVAAGGFIWKGKPYASLSKVAHAITGTKWNGPRFFGLR